MRDLLRHQSFRVPMLYTLAALAVLVLCVPARALQPFPADGTSISEVVIEGLERTDESRVLSVMELKEGRPYNREAQRRDMQAIIDLGSYNPLTLSISSEDTEEGVRLTVRVDENPVVGKISILGNVKYSQQRLLDELDFKPGDLLPLAAKSATARNLRGFYEKGGYKSTTIRVNVEPAEEPNSVNVSIVIDEGEKIRIKDLKITGNSHFSRFRINTSVLNSGSWLFFRNHYDDDAFDDDLRTVEAMYRDDGYLDATVRRGEFEYNSDKGEVTPEMVVNEGPRYRIAGVEVSGNHLITDEEIREEFKAGMGRYFDGVRFSKALREVYHLFGEQGYANAVIDGDFEKRPESGTVILKLTIEENEIVRVGRILVKKNNYEYEVDLNPLENLIDWSSPGIRDEAVLKEVTLEPGDRYNTREEDRTIRRLRNLGIFKRVEIVRQPTEDPSVQDVLVDVEQDVNAGYLSATAGFGEVSGFAVGVNYVNPDLFGEARLLKIGATLGSKVQSFNIGYLDRHFKDSDNSFEISTYIDSTWYEEIGHRSYGAWVEYGIPVSDYNMVMIRTRGEWVDMKADDADDLHEDLSSYTTGAVRVLFVRDLRNDRKWTTEGYRASGGVELGGSRQILAKMLTDVEWYRALDDPENWVYRLRNNFSIQPYDADRVGFTERFFLGGRNSLRGFKVHGAGPVDEDEDDVFTGGSTFWSQSHELRRRFNDYVVGRLFVDVGMLNEDAFEFGSLRASTGAGVSFDAGAFVVDFDAGIPIAIRKHDETQVLSFSIRSSF